MQIGSYKITSESGIVATVTILKPLPQGEYTITKPIAGGGGNAFPPAPAGGVEVQAEADSGSGRKLFHRLRARRAARGC
jgi:hypothetical protein